MLEISPDRFVYSGQRSVRGVMADVWTGETLSMAGGGVEKNWGLMR